MRFLERSLETMEQYPLPPWLHGGFLGIPYVVEHLVDRLISLDEGDDPNRDVDAALLRSLTRQPWTGTHDVTSGLVGLGLYALERLPAPSGHLLCERVLEQLEGRAESVDDGTAWITPRELIPEHERPKSSRGAYITGMAHGNACIYGLLARYVTLGVLEKRSRDLLYRGTRWLMSHQLPEGSDSRYPRRIVDGEASTGTRFAWCNGDPGIAMSLLCAARALGDAALEKIAIATAKNVAVAPPDRARVADPMICHGASGLAHIFHKLFRATGDEAFAEAARFWLVRALELRRDDVGIGGFAAHELTSEMKAEWIANPGLLTGAAGVGLVLLSATSENTPDWDRLILTDIPK